MPAASNKSALFPSKSPNATHLQLSERESTASTNAAVVLDARAANDWTELVDWARGNGGCLLDAVLSTAVLAAGLEEKENIRVNEGP
jgi:hypothetical protein